MEENIKRNRQRIIDLFKGIREWSTNIDDDTPGADIEVRLNRLDTLFVELQKLEDELFEIDRTADMFASGIENELMVEKSKLIRLLRERSPVPPTPMSSEQMGPILNSIFEQQRLFFHNMQDTTVKFERSILNETVNLPKVSIDKFDGSYKNWPAFEDAFKSTVHNNSNLPTVMKFRLLKRFLTDSPLSLIKNMIENDANYTAAWEKLESRYKKPKFILNSYITAFLDIKPTVITKSSDIRAIADKADEIIMGISTMGEEAEERDGWLIQILLRKLDEETRLEWVKESYDIEYPTMAIFLHWLNLRCDGLDHSKCLKSSAAPKLDSRTKVQTLKSMPISTDTESSCLFCHKSGHSLSRCSKFRYQKAGERRSIILKLKVCENCLKPGHISVNCKSNQRCRFCKQLHHSSIHVFASSSHSSSLQSPSQQSPSQQSPGQSSVAESTSSHEDKHTTSAVSTVVPLSNKDLVPVKSAPVNSASVNSAFTSPRSVPLPTALVNIRNRVDTFEPAHCLLDSGSQCSFVSEPLVQRLGLIRHHSTTNVNGLGNKKTMTTKGCVRIELSSRFNPQSRLFVNAYIVSSILSLTPVDIPWKPETLQLADPDFETSREIDILLGSDVFFDVIKSPRIVIDGHTLAQETFFGWILLAPFVDDLTHVQNFSVLVEDDVNNILQRFWEVEEPPSRNITSSDDSPCEKIFSDSLSRTTTGHYQVSLPFKDPPVLLGHSKSAAVRRLFAMEKRFTKDPQFANDYRKFMREYLELRHMELVPHSDLNKPDNEVYYLPHHAVLKSDSSTTKLRVVFDGSCKTSSGFSLNDALLVGPTLQPDLVSILLRFRQHRIVITADIEKMYRQVFITPPHDDFQRVLWRDSPNDQIETYRLKTVTYGTSSAPFLAVRSLHKVAEDIAEVNPGIAQIIKTNFYIDDLLTGGENLSEVHTIFKTISKSLSQGGFDLRKWKSNSDEFLSQLPPHQRDPSCLNINQENTSTKTLGIQWRPNQDTFSFVINLKSASTTNTKRELLSQIATIFDPMGWLSPTTICLKLLFQKLWTTTVGWDDALPPELNEQWLNFKEQLSELESISIPRHVPIHHEVEIQLHGFSDSSEVAYSAVVYFRVRDSEGKVSTSLIMSKTKVAPIKQLSLPRLELSGAYLLSKLIKYVVNVFSDCQLKVFAWTDSTVVLSWLSDHPRRWKTFVGNRTASILEILPRPHWRHVPSQTNPADCASRGISPAELLNHPMWWSGPDWLSLPESEWPNAHLPIERDNVPEKRLVSLAVTNIPKFDSHLAIWLNWKSSFSKLCRIVAYILRFHPKFKTSHLVDRIRAAEKLFVRHVQAEVFHDELGQLEKNLPIRRSHLQSLSPFIDGDGILRVGGRLANVDCHFDLKHPIILPSSHRLTDMIVREYHLKHLHPGPSLLLSLLRQRFWVVHGRKVARSFKCLRCFRFQQKTSSQLMGQLPKPRVMSRRVFETVGVDYAGPLHLRAKYGRARGRPVIMKGYIALFICLATKAVHIELVSDMTAEAFVAALKRFVSIRGIPAEIFSDNGTNFVGAARELAELHQLFIDQNSRSLINAFFTENLIRFRFNPPSAPHFGGLWEANVKLIKTHLKRVTNDIPLTYEEMDTLLKQISAIINSRPICPMSSSPDDLRVLTAGSFLTGEAPTTLPEPDVTTIPTSRLSIWQLIQQRLQLFWGKWSLEYINTLQQRPKWRDAQPNLAINDLVLVMDNNLPPSKWLLARIVQLHPGADNLVRVATIKTQFGQLKRPIAKLCRLPLDEEYNQSS